VDAGFLKVSQERQGDLRLGRREWIRMWVVQRSHKGLEQVSVLTSKCLMNKDYSPRTAPGPCLARS
jgi:hypothetical protein